MATKLSSDDNVYAYVVPYEDAYSTTDFKFNLKDKLSDTTHYALNYNLAYASYGQLVEKNYLKNLLGTNIEEDLSETLVATGNVQIIHFDYADFSSSKYDYFHLTLTPGLRFYIFDWNFTSIDWGLQYSFYNLPNYNFSKEGWTPTLSFQEEVAEYHGFGTFLTLKQGLPWSLDLELTGKMNYLTCPERPLYTRVNDDFSRPQDYRHDLETTLSIGLMRRMEKSSYVQLNLCSSPLQSNANAQVYAGPVSGVVLQEDYYSRAKLRLVLDALYAYGPESSYMRLYATYTQLNYVSRNAQDQNGSLLTDKRADQEYSALLELNQRLGYWLGIAWMLKLSYQYQQNATNDYYYNFKREIISLGLNSALYL